MGKITPIFLAIITSFNANSFAFGQTAPELPQLITQLHDPVTSDEASIKLKALAANNADARRLLVTELPELISKTSQDSSRYIVWINSVQLAGELKNRGNHTCTGELVRPCQIQPFGSQHDVFKSNLC